VRFTRLRPSDEKQGVRRLGMVKLTDENSAIYKELGRLRLRNAALQWKERRRMELLAGGTSIEDANNLARLGMLRKFMPEYPVPASLKPYLEVVSGEVILPTAPEPQSPPQRESPRPAGEPVVFPPPENAPLDFLSDVAWVYQNYWTVVVVEPGKEAWCDWSKAQAPTGGARGMMEWAATNRTAFFKDVAGRYLGREGSEEEDARVKRDELKADHVLEVLRRYEAVEEERRKEEWI